MDEQPHPAKNPRNHLPLLGLCFIPVIAAFFCTDNIPVARAHKGHVDRPALAFMQHAVNLGKVRSTATIPGYFDFWNQGQHPLVIDHVEPSCGCLGPRIAGDKMVYQPGERGRIYVSVATANEESGPKNYTLDVQYHEQSPTPAVNKSTASVSLNSEQKKVTKGGLSERVAFLLDIPERKVTVSPSEVHFYQLSGKADHREIVVADHRGSQLTVVDASISSEHATITLGEPHRTERGVWATPIRIDVAGNVPPGRKVAIATIITSDPDYDRIRIPVMIEGNSQKIQLTSGVADPQSQSATESDTGQTQSTRD